jgi:uncharacterized protein YecE (DUF72 family)
MELVSSAKIYIGTSGWKYKGWANSFYPAACPAKLHLDFYITQFPTVEINASFYRLLANARAPLNARKLIEMVGKYAVRIRDDG